MAEVSTHLPPYPCTVAASPTELQSYDFSFEPLPPITQQPVAGSDDQKQIIVYDSATAVSRGMARGLYEAAECGAVNKLWQWDNWMHQKTPRGNNVLHVHVGKLLGIRRGVFTENVSISFIQYVLNITSENSLLSQTNDKGDTPLHVAARFGHKEAVQEFLNRLDQVGVDELLNKANNNNDTALHDAVRGGYFDTVKLLVEAGGCNENGHQHMPNNLSETPLFLAAERGSAQTFGIIVRHTGITALRLKGPCGQTPLHAAVLHGNKEIVNLIMQHYDSSSLIRLKNDQGQTPLHCCARNVKKYHTILRSLLNYDNEYNSAAYIQDNEGRTPLHIAALNCNYRGIRMLIGLCPDCIEMIDNKGQNVVHYAAKTGRLHSFRQLLKKAYKCEKLMNEKDNDGNTPLHILAAITPKDNTVNDWRMGLTTFIRRQKTLDVMAFNNNNFTAADIIHSNDTFRHLSVQLQPYKILPRGRRVNNGDPNKQGTERGETVSIPEVKESSKKKQEQKISNLKKIGDTRLVVAALIATVSFTAGFTVPGGFDQSPGKNMGMAVLVKKTAFVAFLISDTIAFTLSSLAILLYFFIASHKDLSVMNKSSMLAQMLNSFSIGALMIAFVTGVYAVVSPSLGVAVITISLIFFLSYLGVLNGNLNLIWHFITIASNKPAAV